MTYHLQPHRFSFQGRLLLNLIYRTKNWSHQYPDRQSSSNLDPYAESLERWVKQDTKRHRTAKQLHREIQALG